jgi:hypothetical protein
LLLDEQKKKWDVYHQDDQLWGKGIMDMVPRTVAATERDQKDERKAHTKGVSLEASIHIALTQTGPPKRPEERQQLQPGRPLKSTPMPKLKPKPNPSSEPNPAPAPAPWPAPAPTPRATSAPNGVMTSVSRVPRWWETVPPRDIMIMAARTVERGVLDVEEQETGDRLKIHVVPLVRYMGKGTEGLQRFIDEFKAENEGIAILTEVQWLAIPCTIKEKR